MSPAVSKKQQRLFAIAEHQPEKLFKRNREVLKMDKAKLKEFAKTKRKGLPLKKKASHYKTYWNVMAMDLNPKTKNHYAKE